MVQENLVSNSKFCGVFINFLEATFQSKLLQLALWAWLDGPAILARYSYVSVRCDVDTSHWRYLTVRYR